MQRENVALKIKLTPHVNEHDIIRLEVDAGDLGRRRRSNYNGLGPSTSKRTAKTTWWRKDQQTILIGGLMSDKIIDSVTKIPILGDIPDPGLLLPQHHQARS